MGKNIAVECVVGILAALGGAVFGALSRQPEINSLNAQIDVLHKEVEKANSTVKGALRDIELLELKYHVSENKDIVFEENNEDYNRVLYAFGFYEYLRLKCDFLLEENDLMEEEIAFIDAYAIHISEEKIDEVQEREINKYIIQYINGKYGEKARNGEKPDFDSVIEKISENFNKEHEEEGKGIAPSETACLTITENQMRIMYSLEYNKIAHDRDATKNPSDKQRKTEWLIKWSYEILKGLGKGGVTGYFWTETETFSYLQKEYSKNPSRNWYYIVMMEVYLFSPYFVFDEKNAKKNPWRGLKYKSDYVDVICSKQKVVNKAFFDDIKKAYKSALSYLDKKTMKLIISLGVTLVVTAATCGLAYAFAPGIAVAIGGSSFSGLHGVALTNASLAYIGGGALATGGMGMAGGVALITGGGAILGTASSGLAALRYAILSASPEIIFRECAKLITCFEKIILTNDNAEGNALSLCTEIDKKCRLITNQIESIDENMDKKEKKTLIKRLEKSKEYYERTKKKMIEDKIKTMKAREGLDIS